MILLRILFTLIYAIIALPISLFIAFALWIRSIPLVWSRRKQLHDKRKEIAQQDIIGEATQEALAEMQPQVEDEPSISIFYPGKSNWGHWD